MTARGCNSPIELPTLVEYWLGELDAAAEARVDEHVLSCAECSARLSSLAELAGGIRAAFDNGMVRAFVTQAFVTRLIERGVRLREYRIPRDGSVDCSVAPEDEVIVTHLEAPLENVGRLDAHYYFTEAEPVVVRDIPFDAAGGEVLVTPKIAQLRSAPSHRLRLRLVAVDANGERVIGDYTFNHTGTRPAH